MDITHTTRTLFHSCHICHVPLSWYNLNTHTYEQHPQPYWLVAESEDEQSVHQPICLSCRAPTLLLLASRVHKGPYL